MALLQHWCSLVGLTLTFGDETLELKAWIRTQPGAYVSEAQKMENFDGVRGLMARTAIAEGQMLAHLPWSVIVGGETQCDLVEATRVELAKKNESFFWPYFHHMEKYDPSLPFTWDDDAYALLEALPPGDWKRHGDWFRGHCDAGSDPTTQRALDLMLARALGDPQTGFAMVPIYDLYNHRNGYFHNTRIQMNYGHGLTIFASRDIDPGEQLYNSYGEDSSGAIFRDYAFVEQRPQIWDFDPIIPIRFRLHLQDALHEDTVIEWLSDRRPRSRYDFDRAVAPITAVLDRPVPPTTSTSSERYQRHRSLALAFRNALAIALDEVRRALPGTDDTAADL